MLLDLAGGFILVFLVLLLTLSGLGWIGWKLLLSRIIVCSTCGSWNLGSSSNRCGLCGASFISKSPSQGKVTVSVPASEVTIDVTAQDVASDS